MTVYVSKSYLMSSILFFWRKNKKKEENIRAKSDTHLIINKKRSKSLTHTSRSTLKPRNRVKKCNSNTETSYKKSSITPRKHILKRNNYTLTHITNVEVPNLENLKLKIDDSMLNQKIKGRGVTLTHIHSRNHKSPKKFPVSSPRKLSISEPKIEIVDTSDSDFSDYSIDEPSDHVIDVDDELFRYGDDDAKFKVSAIYAEIYEFLSDTSVYMLDNDGCIVYR